MTILEPDGRDPLTPQSTHQALEAVREEEPPVGATNKDHASQQLAVLAPSGRRQDGLRELADWEEEVAVG